MELAKQAATLALPVTHPVATMDDWCRLKQHYEFSETRLGAVQPAPGKVTLPRDRVAVFGNCGHAEAWPSETSGVVRRSQPTGL
jgi:hypothetical protein